jgi:hypothetical protein
LTSPGFQLVALEASDFEPSAFSFASVWVALIPPGPALKTDEVESVIVPASEERFFDVVSVLVMPPSPTLVVLDLASVTCSTPGGWSGPPSVPRVLVAELDFVRV